MATVYAVASSKGGVGKTTTTVNLGATLASAGLSVAVVDGDIGMANLGDALGVDPDGATLHDVLAEDSEVAPEDAVYEGPAGVAVVPGDTSIDGFRAAEPANLAAVIDALDDYDYVLVDTGAGLSHDTVLPLGLADEVVLVSTTERDSLTDTEKTRQVVDRLGGTTRGVVLTSVDPDDPNAEEVAARLDADVIEAIPADPVVRESMQLADPLARYAPGSPAASAYRALAGSLTGESIPTPEVVDEPADETTEADDAGETSTADEETAGTDDTDAEPAGETESVEVGAVETGSEDGEASDAEDGEAIDAEDGETTDAEDGDGITLGSPAEGETGEEADDGITLTESEEGESEEIDAGATESEDLDLDTTDEDSAGEDVLSADDADPAADDDEDAEASETAAGESDDAETTETVDDTGAEAETEAETADDSEEGVGADDADDAGDPSGLTDDDALAADTAPSDDPLVADSAEPDEGASADEDDDTVFATSLVEEAEPTEDDSDDSGAATDTDEDAAFVETDDEDDEDDDDGGKGFLGRLLG
ncbi:AAA family ATPase [Salinirubrum litoreum]|uniref:AAA family ATPase n=1 Tax=Salinirubrum litoreum TaxID=1126234 RepID=A0ABD5R9A4_9EURY|nr:AAA family ATPase [Salinirubrum litoreum]